MIKANHGLAASRGGHREANRVGIRDDLVAQFAKPDETRGVMGGSGMLQDYEGTGDDTCQGDGGRADARAK